MSYTWFACVALCLTPILPAHTEPEPDPDRAVIKHQYPREGHVVRVLPRARHAIVARDGHRYYYSRGVWYAPRGPRYVVVRAPTGVIVPDLPPYHSRIRFGGVHYFVADGTYYVWRESERGYEVVDPPEIHSSIASASDADIFMYPKDGQSADQQARDRYECHRWAAEETQFDPTQPGGGVTDEQNASKRRDYRRAMTACLEGRGYSVK